MFEINDKVVVFFNKENYYSDTEIISADKVKFLFSFYQPHSYDSVYYNDFYIFGNILSIENNKITIKDIEYQDRYFPKEYIDGFLKEKTLTVDENLVYHFEFLKELEDKLNKNNKEKFQLVKLKLKEMDDIASDVQNILKEMGVESVASLADGAPDLSSIGDSIVSSLGWSPSAASC